MIIIKYGVFTVFFLKQMNYRRQIVVRIIIDDIVHFYNWQNGQFLWSRPHNRKQVPGIKRFMQLTRKVSNGLVQSEGKIIAAVRFFERKNLRCTELAFLPDRK